jgi:hypothetical protein
VKSRQTEKRGNACLIGKRGVQASGKARECLPVKRKGNPGKQKSEKMLACEAKRRIQASRKDEKCLPERIKEESRQA